MRKIILFFQAIAAGVGKIRGGITNFDTRMRERYDPLKLTIVVLAGIAAVMVILLFVPPYMGLSNDGGFDNVLADVGLARLTPDDSTAYFSYYERQYRIEPNVDAPGTTPLPLQLVVRFAILVDSVLTGDNIFDMRALAAIYMALYLLVLFPGVRFLLSHVRSYSSGLFLGVILVAVFADATVVTRFASLYTQPLEWLLMLTILGGGISMAQRQGEGAGMLVMAAATMLLMGLNRYCALAGLVLSLMYWTLALEGRGLYRRLGLLLLALILVTGSVISTGHLLMTQTRAEKYNQMTRGVLFQADNPEKALEEFGIDQRYSMLTETYADQSYPVADLESGVLDNGFLDEYNVVDVLWYYARHPVAAISMLDNGVHSAFTTQSDYSGNYEQSAGLPPMAKALFPTIWSVFKSQSAPRTLGTVVVAMGVLLVFTRKRREIRMTDAQEQRRFLLNMNFYIYVLFSLVELMTVVVMSGDSEMIRESSLMGGTIDVMFVWLIANMLKKSGQYGEEK